jgi:hypothetical protein
MARRKRGFPLIAATQATGIVKEFGRADHSRAYFEMNGAHRAVQVAFQEKPLHRNSRDIQGAVIETCTYMEFMDGVKVGLIADGTVKVFDRRSLPHGAEIHTQECSSTDTFM